MKLFKIDPLPDSQERNPTYINIDLIAVVVLRSDTAIITMNLAYSTCVTTRACGERLVALMSKEQAS